MKFTIETKEEPKELKSVRFPKELVSIIQGVSDKNNITFSRFVILACKYALNNMEDK